jgi:uncharacterized Fe-S center protein
MDRYKREVDGVVYCLGIAGSFLLSCPSCGRDRFRQEVPNIEYESCLGCGTQMEMVRADELETRWKPFWRSIDET